MNDRTTVGGRRRGVRLAAGVTALLVGLLGLSAPTAAQAANPPGPSGPHTVSGTIVFPASAPAGLKGPIDDSEPDYLKRQGIYLSLVLDRPGTSRGWWLEKPGSPNYSSNVTYNPATGMWSITGVGNGTYRLSISVLLPKNGSAPGVNRTVTVNNGDVSIGNTNIDESGRLRVVSVSCASALTASSITATNRATGRTYPIAPSQSGWIEPHARCSGDAGYGNYHVTGLPPAGDYTVSFSQKGITEYYTGSEVGSLDPSEAAAVTLKSWEGNTTEMMYGLARPIAAETPRISGAVKTGSTLKASAGKWTSGAKLGYQWKRDGANIGGATRSSYQPKPKDRGKKLTVTVTGTKTGYWPAAQTSKATKSVAKGTLKTSKPKIRGSKKVGKTLKATRGSWTKGTGFSYRWYRSGKAITGAKQSSYRVKSADAGKRITVKVTGKKAGYATKSRNSSPTARIKR